MNAVATIRRGTPADAEQITPVHVASIRTLCAGDYTQRQIDAWAGWKTPAKYRAAMEAGEVFFVAEAGGRIVGFSVLDRDEVKAVYLHPDQVGQGLGRRLLRAVEEEARAQGVKELHLTSTLTSVRFYEACGYARGEPHQHPVLGGVLLPCVMFTKRL
jgi:GNAT superfamily N-acetyltransferase